MLTDIIITIYDTSNLFINMIRKFSILDLPNDIVYIELAQYISKVDLFCLELATKRKKLPIKQYFLADMHEQIVREGLRHYQYFDKYKVFDNTESMNLAAKHGQLKIIKYGIDNKFVFNNRALCNAAEYGHLKCVKLLLSGARLRCNDNTAIAAVKGGYLDCVGYICKKRDCNVHKVIPVAARHGHLEVFKMLIQMSRWVDVAEFIEDATIVGHLHIIKYIMDTQLVTIERFNTFRSRLYGQAIIHKQYHVLAYFLLNYIHNNLAYKIAIKHDDIVALQCIFDSGVAIDDASRATGLTSNNPEVVAWFTAH